ncbi:hypothetical protein P3T43_001970 [Paraburkholderia sp. GAS41]
MVADYVYRRGHFVVLLAVATETGDWAHARGCDLAVVWEGVSVSVYVDVGFVYGFVVDSEGFVGFFCLRRFGGSLTALAFPCFVIGLFASPLCGAALTFFAAAKKVSKESGLTPPAGSEPSKCASGNGPTRDVPSHLLPW